MCNRSGLAFGVRLRVRVGFRVRVGLGVNKLDVNYNIVTSPLYSTLAIAALGYSGPESEREAVAVLVALVRRVRSDLNRQI